MRIYRRGIYQKRRLTLAGSELVSTDWKIIDIALRYGYDSPDSFTKAFTRFHGATPTSVRKGETIIKAFAPLKIKLTLEGGYTMDYKIVKKKLLLLLVYQRYSSTKMPPARFPDYGQNFIRQERTS